MADPEFAERRKGHENLEETMLVVKQSVESA